MSIHSISDEETSNASTKWKWYRIVVVPHNGIFLGVQECFVFLVFLMIFKNPRRRFKTWGHANWKWNVKAFAHVQKMKMHSLFYTMQLNQMLLWCVYMNVIPWKPFYWHHTDQPRWTVSGPAWTRGPGGLGDKDMQLRIDFISISRIGCRPPLSPPPGISGQQGTWLPLATY